MGHAIMTEQLKVSGNTLRPIRKLTNDGSENGMFSVQRSSVQKLLKRPSQIRLKGLKAKLLASSRHMQAVIQLPTAPHDHKKLSTTKQ